MDIKAINYFIAVYEERSFTRAADRMHVVQPALSMQIRNLEEELGASLFDRNPRGVEPTIAGRRFYELSLPIARNVATAKQEIIDLVQGNRVAGSIRVGVPPSVCLGVMGSVLNDFSELYPNVDLTVVEDYSRNLTEQLQAGELDVALGALPPENSSLSCQHSYLDHFVLVCGQPILGPTLKPVDLYETRRIKLIVPTERHLIGNTVLDFIMSGQLTPAKVMKVDGLITSLECARASDWAAMCPVIGVINDLQHGGLHIYPISRPALRFDLYRLHDPRRPPTLAARSFLDMLQVRLDTVSALRERAFAIAVA